MINSNSTTEHIPSGISPITPASQERLPLALMLIIALLQGVALYVVYQTIREDMWTDKYLPLLVLIISVLVVLPVLHNTVINRANQQRARLWLIGAAIVLAAMSYYTGWQIGGWEAERGMSREPLMILIYSLCVIVIGFKWMMYAQRHSNHESLTYTVLFRYSWRNSLTLALAFLFTALIYAALALAAALFNVIELKFFSRLIGESWFFIPTVTMLVTLGIIVFRRMPETLDTIQHILSALFQWCLVLLSVFALLFIVALAVQGLGMLWQTGRGTFLVLLLQLVFLFSLNAVYRDYQQTPYPRWAEWLVRAGMMTLPVYGVIACYGLYLRVDEYGLTVQRLWAMYLAGMLLVLGTAYVVAQLVSRFVAAKSAPTQRVEGKVNMVFGLLVMGTLVLTQLPIFDFKHIALKSQIARYYAADKTMAAEDVYYIVRYLGRSGQHALDKLMTDDTALAKRYETCRENWWQCRRNRNSTANEQGRTELFLPESFVLPEELRTQMRLQSRFTSRQDVVFFKQDFDADGFDEYVEVNYEFVRVWFLPAQTSDTLPLWQSHMTYIDIKHRDEFFEQIRKTPRIDTQKSRWPDMMLNGRATRLNF